MHKHPVVIHLQLFLRYLSFFFKAKTKYDIDSPFVSDFIEHILEDKRRYYAFPLIQWMRQQLSKDKEEITIKDYGAGSLLTDQNQRSIAHIARHGAINDSQGQILFKIVHHYKSNIILELGTSLGLSTLYLALADKRNQVITIEGSPEIAQKASENFYRLYLENIFLINDTFDKALNVVRQEFENIDLIYIDGDHREGSTWAYFERLLPQIHQDTILILADIYWSKEMKRAWQKIKAHQRIKAAIDIFDFGFLFFNPIVRQKIDVKLVPTKYKFWRMGIRR